MLTIEEIRYLLGLIADTLPGRLGYSPDPLVGHLQAKLSMLLQAKTEHARRVAAETAEVGDA